jgi:xylulokinase
VSGSLLAVDLGTESVRACLVSPAGRIIESARRGYALQTPMPGWAEQHPGEWWEAAASAIREVLARAGGADVVSVGVCGQMHGPVPIARDGGLLPGPVQLWCDKRGAPLVDEIAARHDAAALCALARNPVTPAWMGVKIAWEQRYRPQRHGSTWKYLAPKDFLNFRLTSVAATDLSEASGSFLMDARTRAWSEDLASGLDLGLNSLPDIRRADEVIGVVTAEAAAQTGLPAGTPVVAGGGDMLCLLLGAGITRPGRACDTTGTASVLSVFSPDPISDPRVMNLHHVVPGWIAFGICDSGGGALRWYRDLTGETYGTLDHAAADVPAGADGLLFFPYLQGERTLGSPRSRGVAFGLTPAHGRGAVARAIMEGVTFELRRGLDLIRASGLHVTEMRTIGGGARSEVWSQIKADIYGLPVGMLAECEGGVIGAAILAGVGAGIYQDAISAAERIAPPARTHEPDNQRAARYERAYAAFTRIHDLLQPGFELVADVLSRAEQQEHLAGRTR